MRRQRNIDYLLNAFLSGRNITRKTDQVQFKALHSDFGSTSQPHAVLWYFRGQAIAVSLTVYNSDYYHRNYYLVRSPGKRDLSLFNRINKILGRIYRSKYVRINDQGKWELITVPVLSADLNQDPVMVPWPGQILVEPALRGPARAELPLVRDRFLDFLKRYPCDFSHLLYPSIEEVSQLLEVQPIQPGNHDDDYDDNRDEYDDDDDLPLNA